MSDRLIKLAAAADEVEAERMQRTLLAAGILSARRNTDALSVTWMLPAPPFSICILVRESEAGLAEQVLGLEPGSD